MCQCHPPYNRQVSSHRVVYLQFLGSYNICIVYLHIIVACLKVAIAMFCFCYSKNPSNIMKNIFNPISIYSWNKIFLLTNVKNKCFMRKINLYFLKLSKMVKFFLFVIFNMITDSFLVEKCRTLERTRKYVCKNLSNLDWI